MKLSIVKILGAYAVITLGLTGCSLFDFNSDKKLSTYQKMSDTNLENFVKTCDDSKLDTEQCKLARQAKTERDSAKKTEQK